MDRSVLFSFNISNILKLCFVFLCLFGLFVYNWRRRWLYYYSYKLPGPLSLPLIGTVGIIFAGQKRVLDILKQYTKKYPPVWRGWIAEQMIILTSEPNHVEFLLTECLSKEKMPMYEFNEEYISSILTSEVEVWKANRKIAIPPFKPKIIDSFTNIFVKRAKILNSDLDGCCKQGSVDLLPVAWRCTINAIFDTLTGVSPEDLKMDSDKLVQMMVRYEKLLTERYFNACYYFNIFWKLSPLSKEISLIVNNMFDRMRKVVDFHTQTKYLTGDKTDAFVDKIYLSHLINMKLPHKEILHETLFMFMAGSETGALITSTTLLILSIYPEIQKKIYEEQCSIFDDIDRDVTLEDLNQMFYLERVIKETLRLFPPVPMLSRYAHKTIELDSHVYPKGVVIAFPLFHIHRNPKYWTDPLKFDPDRFLPERIARIPRGCYIPFSIGPRNCIGEKYGMLSLIAILSTVLRKFEVKPGKYKSIGEIDTEYHFVETVKDGYRIALQPRKCS